MNARRLGLWVESAWDAARLRRPGRRTPEDLRIEGYLGHGGAQGVVIRHSVLKVEYEPPPPLLGKVPPQGDSSR